MLPSLSNRRRPGAVSVLTLALVLVHFAAVILALWVAWREAATLDAREAAVEQIVSHIDSELGSRARNPPSGAR